MQLSFRGLALRGAFGALMIGAGLMGAPAFAASGHGHEHGGSTSTQNGHAKLDRMPTGTASLTWDHTKKQLTVDLSLTGLTPGGSYTANLEQGKCDKATSATVVDPLTGIGADGKSHTVLTDSKVANGIPHKDWFVAVSQGSTMVACGNVRDMHHEGDKGDKGHKGHEGHKGQQTQQASDETAKAKLNATQHVHGEAHLHLKDGTLTVKMNANGLKSGATYLAEIDQGSCSALGSSTPILASTPSNQLTRNADGDWTWTATKSGTGLTAIPDGQWYAAIWSSDHSNLLACGNVKVGDHGEQD